MNRYDDIRYDERVSVIKQLQQARTKAQRAWVEGFAAAAQAVRNGATLERLEQMVPEASAPVIARAPTVAIPTAGPLDDTIPWETIDSEEPTEVDICIPRMP